MCANVIKLGVDDDSHERGGRAESYRNLQRIIEMDKDRIAGVGKQMKGSVKETAGKMMGDKKMQAEGKMDKAKGAARQAAGDVKDAVRRTDKE